MTEQPDLNIAQIRDDAARAERERIAGILDHQEAAGRQKLARALAFGTDMTPEAAAVILSAAEKDRPAFKSLAERSKESAEPGMDHGPSGAAPGGMADLAADAEARRQRVIDRVSGPDAAR